MKSDIKDEFFMNNLSYTSQFECVIHLVAESHINRSISNPSAFAKTNILGTMILLNAFKKLWQNNWEGKRFYHESTDEVYSFLGPTGLFEETTSYGS